MPPKEEPPQKIEVKADRIERKNSWKLQNLIISHRKNN
jgi:hypothetical protein